jgi:hypothetical protein
MTRLTPGRAPSPKLRPQLPINPPVGTVGAALTALVGPARLGLVELVRPDRSQGCRQATRAS